MAASGTASVVPVFPSSCSNTSCAIRPSGTNRFAPKIKAQPSPTVQQPLPPAPRATRGCSPALGAPLLVGWEGRAWKSLPVPPIPLPACLGVPRPAGSPWVLKANSCLVCPARFAVLSLISALGLGIPHSSPAAGRGQGVRTCLARGAPAAPPWTCLSLLPAAGGVGWCHLCRAVTARWAVVTSLP